MPTSPAKVVSLRYLFDRPHATHPWDPMLARTEADPTVGLMQVAANWRMDHRVSEDKEKVLASSGCFPAGPVAPATLAMAAADYHQCYQCLPVGGMPEPQYRGASNKANRIDMSRISPNVFLVHLASLDRLLRFALRRGAPGRADLEAYLNGSYGLLPPDPTQKTLHKAFCDRLAHRLNADGEDAVRDFSRRVSDALGSGEPHWWACFAYEIDPSLGGEDWSEAVEKTGLGHLEENEWLIGWRYPALEAAPLFRPTVLEATENGFHYPSPHDYNYGLTMALASTGQGVAEVVHAPFKGDDSAEFSLGRIGRLTRPYASIHNDAEMKAWFGSRRASHKRLLAAEFPNDKHWFDRHRALP